MSKLFYFHANKKALYPYIFTSRILCCLFYILYFAVMHDHSHFDVKYFIFFVFYFIRFVAGVGRACLMALLDIRNQNPCSRITTSKYKTLDKVRQSVLEEVQRKWEYRNQSTHGVKQKTLRGLSLESQVQVPSIISNLKVLRKGRNSIRCYASACDSKIWRSYADGVLNIADGVLNIMSNDDIENDRSCDNKIDGDKNDHSIYSNDHHDDDNNNNDEDVINNSESKDTNDDNDKNDDRKKTRRKKSLEGRKISISTYDSNHARQFKSLNSLGRTLASPLTAAAASKARRQSTSSLWPGIRSTTAEVAGFQVAGSQLAGHRRAGSVGSLNLRYHRVVPLSSSCTVKHPNFIPHDPVQEVKSSSSHGRLCPEMFSGYEYNNANNYKGSYTAVRKNSMMKIEPSDSTKSSSTILTPTSKQSKTILNKRKKDTERKKSEENDVIASSEKSYTKKTIDDDLNGIISLKISVTSSQAPILITCKSQKVILNTGIIGQNLHKICARTPEEEGMLLFERLLSEKYPSQKSSPSKQSSSSSNKTLLLRKKGDKFPVRKKNVVIIKNKNADYNENVIDGEKTALQSYLKTKNKEYSTSDESKQPPVVCLSSKNNQAFNNITPDTSILNSKIQNDSNSNNSHQVSSQNVSNPLKNDNDRSCLKGYSENNHHRNSFSTHENLRDTFVVKKESRNKRNSVPQRN